MLVWRVEDDTGGGIYHSGGWVVLFESDFGTSQHPTPGSDYVLSPKWNKIAVTDKTKYRFGFASEEQLNAWFHPDIQDEILSNGFHINQYEVPDEDVLVGDKQAAFLPNRAKKVLSYALHAT